MKHLFLHICLIICISANAQSHLQNYVQDFNDCTMFKVDNVKAIAECDFVDVPYKIYLFKQSNDWYFTIEISKYVTDKRQLVYSILKDLQLENVKLSEVKQTY